jgi:hypothetical protein
MAGFTNRGMKMMFDTFFRGAAAPANFYLALCTSATAPTADTNTLSDLTEITAGNGYTSGGQSVARNTTDFDTITENDASSRVELQLKDEAWTASGGIFPASGGGARYTVLLDDNATVGSRQVIFWWDNTASQFLSDTQTLTLINLEIRLTTPVGWTNRGAYRVLNSYFRAQNTPANFYLALITSATTPTATTNSFSELTEIANGNGYTTGGISVARNSTDFPTLTEDDANDRAALVMKNQVWTAATGNLPASGGGARNAVLLDDNATIGSRDVLTWSWETAKGNVTVSVGNTLTVAGYELRGLN